MKNKVVIFSFCATLQIFGLAALVIGLVTHFIIAVLTETAIALFLISDVYALVALLPWLRTKTRGGSVV